MNEKIVFTLTGPDRIGIVEEVTQLLLELGGNVETSRMARLGGEFAVLMLITLPTNRLDSLDTAMARLTIRGYKTTTNRTEQTHAEAHPGWRPCRLEVHGADHEGIMHQIARYLAQRGITIESMDAETVRASISGTPLFGMTAMVLVPPGLAGQDWEAALVEMGGRLNVDIKIDAITKLS